MATTVNTGSSSAAGARAPAAAAYARRDKWQRRMPLLPALIFTIILTQIPFLLTIWYSLRSWNLLNPASDVFVGLANYAAIFTDRTFRQVALNSVLYTVGCVAGAMLLGIGLALLLDRKFVGQGLVRTMLITPFLIMPVVTGILWSL
jgi:sorbitol/mannitol transport system permease protein